MLLWFVVIGLQSANAVRSSTLESILFSIVILYSTVLRFIVIAWFYYFLTTVHGSMHLRRGSKHSWLSGAEKYILLPPSAATRIKYRHLPKWRWFKSGLPEKDNLVGGGYTLPLCHLPREETLNNLWGSKTHVNFALLLMQTLLVRYVMRIGTCTESS